MRLIAKPGRIVGGSILFDGLDILAHERARNSRRARARDLDDLPGPDDVAQPGAHDRAPDHGDPRGAGRNDVLPRRGSVPIELLVARRHSRRRSVGLAIIRIISPAACDSA